MATYSQLLKQAAGEKTTTTSPGILAADHTVSAPQPTATHSYAGSQFDKNVYQFPKGQTIFSSQASQIHPSMVTGGYGPEGYTTYGPQGPQWNPAVSMTGQTPNWDAQAARARMTEQQQRQDPKNYSFYIDRGLGFNEPRGPIVRGKFKNEGYASDLQNEKYVNPSMVTGGQGPEGFTMYGPQGPQWYPASDLNTGKPIDFNTSPYGSLHNMNGKSALTKFHSGWDTQSEYPSMASSLTPEQQDKAIRDYNTRLGYAPTGGTPWHVSGPDGISGYMNQEDAMNFMRSQGADSDFILVGPDKFHKHYGKYGERLPR